QISYAVQDITYLTDLYRIFRKEIMAKGLEEEAARSFEQIASVSWTEKTLDPFGHLRIKGSREMTRSQRTRLKALYRWRFRKAKETNTAMFMILSDQHLSELARSKIRSLSSLRRSEKLPPGKADRFGPEIVSALNESPDFPAQDRSKNA
ncbi:MAG: HRDC domain-containing protein, partial [Syntrophales bacterium]|nr:HRDC domain-containing protein [Syntrophales bacterium]